MRVEIASKELVEAIKGVEAAVAKRSYVPILTGIRLQASAAGLSLEATDLELTIELLTQAQTAEDGVMVVPAKQLIHAAKAMVGPNVTIQDDAGGLPGLSLNCGRKTITIESFSVEDWPQAPSAANLREVATVDSNDLAEALGKVTTCASNDEGRPVLTGVQFVFDSETRSAELVATDSYRLGIATVALQSVGQISQDRPLASARSLKALSRKLTGFRGRVAILANTGDTELMCLAFEFGTARWTMRQIEGAFPDWHRIVPDESKGGSLEFDPKELSAAVADAAGLRSDKSIPVRVGLGTTCNLRMIDGNVGRLNQELGSATYSPNGTGPMEIGFNPSFLKDAIDFVGTKSVYLRVTDPCKPALFLGSPTRKVVVMPVRLP